MVIPRDLCTIYEGTMAQLSRKSVSCKGPYCYIWVALALFLTALIIIGISTSHKVAIYAGVMCLLMSAISGVIYFIKLHCRRYNIENEDKISCSYCCGLCFWITKLPNNDHFQLFTSCFRESSDLRNSSNSNINNSSVNIINGLQGDMDIYHTHINRNPDDVSSILQALRDELCSLYQQYGLLRIDAFRMRETLEDYAKMETVDTCLKQWSEQQTVPSNGELNEMRRVLDIIQQNICVIRFRTRQGTSNQMDISKASPPQNMASSTSSIHQLMLYTTQVSIPPPYEVDDPMAMSRDTAHGRNEEGSREVRNQEISMHVNDLQQLYNYTHVNSTDAVPAYSIRNSLNDGSNNSSVSNSVVLPNELPGIHHVTNYSQNQQRTDNSINETHCMSVPSESLFGSSLPQETLQPSLVVVENSIVPNNITIPVEYNNTLPDNIPIEGGGCTSPTNVLDITSHISGSECSLAPPVDDSDAPPCYQQSL